MGEQVLIRIDVGPQIEAGEEEGVQNQAHRHAAEENAGKPVKALLGLGKEHVADAGGNIEKPQQIGDDKVLAEGNHVVNPQLDDGALGGIPLLQQIEPGEIHQDIEQYPALGIFGDQFFHMQTPQLLFRDKRGSFALGQRTKQAAACFDNTERLGRPDGRSPGKQVHYSTAHWKNL